jgi:hypothetical protein
MEEGICIPLSDISPNLSSHLKSLNELKINPQKEISIQNALEVKKKKQKICVFFLFQSF